MSFTVVILALSSALWVLVVALFARAFEQDRQRVTPARVGQRLQRATSARPSVVARTLLRGTHLATSGRPESPYDGFSTVDERPLWMRLGLGNRPPEPPVVGRAANIRWWERARSAIGLVILVMFLAALFLATLGALAWTAGFLLERAI